MVVAKSQEVRFIWFMADMEVHMAQMQVSEEQHNNAFHVVSVLPILHQDWLSGKGFKYKVNSGPFPVPTEKTISKVKGGI